MTNSQYSWCSSIFYVGAFTYSPDGCVLYTHTKVSLRSARRRIPFHLPHVEISSDEASRNYNVIMQPMLVIRSLANSNDSIVWGAICMCLAAPQSFASFAAVRFMLGFSEGAVSPAFVTITSIWYRKEEHATRTG